MTSVLLLTGLLVAGASGASPARAAPQSPREVASCLDETLKNARDPGVGEAPPADDAAFLRRAWLDLAGRVPPVRVVRKFLADTAAPGEKRSRAVESILDSPEFASYQASVWAEYLTDRRPFSQEGYDGRLLQGYLRDAIQQKGSYADIVSALLNGEGPSDTSGPVNFLLRYNAEPVQIAGAVSRKLLGLTLQCAECHDHPHARWTKDEFWGLAAYFGRLRRMQSAGGQFVEGENFFLIVERPRGELRIPDRTATPADGGAVPKKTVFPRLPGSKTIDHSPQRREALLKWLVDPSNPYFARHAVNRTWLQLLGRPLTPTLEPKENEPKPATGPALELLADDFARHGFDLRRLYTVIVLSDAYQRSAGRVEAADESSPATENEERERITARQREAFTRFAVRPLSADQIHHSLASGLGFRGDEGDSQVAAMTSDDFTYDQPQDFFKKGSLTLPRALAILNGEQVRGAAGRGADTVLRLYGNDISRDHIEWLYLATCSRSPTDRELEMMLDLAELQAESRAGLEDVVWVLLNSAEFLTNH